MRQMPAPSHDNAAATSMTSSAHQQPQPRVNNTLKISPADSPTSTAFTCQKKVKQSFGCHFFSIDFPECSGRAGERRHPAGRQRGWRRRRRRGRSEEMARHLSTGSFAKPIICKRQTRRPGKPPAVTTKWNELHPIIHHFGSC